MWGLVEEMTTVPQTADMVMTQSQTIKSSFIHQSERFTVLVDLMQQ